MTGPMTCATRPSFMKEALLCSSLQGIRAAHDLGDLLGDLRLAGAVVLAREDLDELLRVVGGVLHRDAARRLLARRQLEERAVDAVPHEERKDRAEDDLG